MRILWVFAIVLAACDHDQSGDVEAACTQVCRCEAPPLAISQQQCLAQCTGAGEISPQEACLDCVFENATSCSTLETTCASVCGGVQTGGGDDSI